MGSKIINDLAPSEIPILFTDKIVVSRDGNRLTKATIDDIPVPLTENQKEYNTYGAVVSSPDVDIVMPDGESFQSTRLIYAKALKISRTGQSSAPPDNVEQIMYSWTLNNPNNTLFKVGDIIEFEALFSHTNSSVTKSFRLYLDNAQFCPTTTATTTARTRCNYRIWLNPEGFVSDGTGGSTQGVFDAGALVLNKSSYNFQLRTLFSGATTDNITLQGVFMKVYRGN